MPHSGRSLTQPASGADDGKRTFGSRRLTRSRHPDFIPLIHINADGGDGGKLATASRVSARREAMARYVAGLTKFIYEPEKAEPDRREHGGGLWPLGAAVHSDGVAQCRHVPDRRRSRWRRKRSAALRRSIAGRTTRTSTKRPGCCGRFKQKYGRKISWADLTISRGQHRSRAPTGTPK